MIIYLAQKSLVESEFLSWHTSHLAFFHTMHALNLAYRTES
jgi:hypothetical protein